MSFIIGLATLVFLLAFTALYLSKSLEKKPAFLTQAVDKITAHLDDVSLWGALFGAAAAVMTLIMIYNTTDMLVRLVCNVMVVLMALPFVFDKIAAKYQEKVNPAIMEEARNFVGWITKQEKYISYAGVVFSILLFSVVFRQ
jgi:hypothetical protein